MKLIASIAFAVGAFSVVVSSHAQTTSPSQPSTLGTAQRATIARDLVARWRDEVVRTPKGNIASWSSKLSKFIAIADESNVMRATTMSTLDGMHAALNGYVPDSPLQPPPTIGNSSVAPQVIGSTTVDVSYTPLPWGRCRVANSLQNSTPTIANTVREIDVEDTASYAGLGGRGTYAHGDGSTNCGIPSFVAALSVRVSVVSPAGTGTMRIFENGTPFQSGNSLFYTAGISSGGDMIVKSCRTCTNEISIQSTTAVNYIVDVLGYFTPPQATALECVDTNTVSTVVQPGTTGYVALSACSSGYTEVNTKCIATTSGGDLMQQGGGYCIVRNNGPYPLSLGGNRVCCRVPGR